MKRAATIFAIVTLAISTIWVLIEHFLGYNTIHHDIGQYARLVPMLFFWVMLFVAIRYERKTHGNSLTFREGFKVGLTMTLIYCAGFTIIIILYQQFLNPELHATLKQFTLEQLQSQHASQEKIDSKLKEVDMSYGGTAMSYLLLFVFSAIWGIGISAIASLIMRRQPKTA